MKFFLQLENLAPRTRRGFLHLDFRIGLLFLTGLLITVLLYWVGLSGSFIFDDYSNLKLLGTKGGINDWTSLKHYLLSGFSGPTGRPVSLLSFLLDANNWPASPRPFKYTNLMLHLLNGSMLFLVCYRILSIHEGNKEPGPGAKWAVLVTVLAWLFHPYLVSTTLYAVQRMAMLAMLFSFVGIYIWLTVRPMVQSRPHYAYSWMLFALLIPGLLGIFSKENAAVLPLLILVIESTIIARSDLPALNRWWRWIFLVAPALLVAGYLVFYASRNGWWVDFPGRNFSPSERLLSQCRILLSYLYNWFIPQLNTSGVFHDHIAVSTSLFRPVTTLPALLALAALVVASLKWRRKWPLTSMAVLFFLSSQIVESTTVALDLMYEHRVYLGSGLLLLPIFYGAFTRYPARWTVPVSGVYLCVLALFCWQNAVLWADYRTMVAVWAEEAPDSPRARVENAKMLYERGLEEKSLIELDRAAERIPGDFFLRLTQLLVQCRVKEAGEEAKRDLAEIARNVDYRPIWFNTMQNFMEYSVDEKCANIDNEYFGKVVDGLIQQPRNHREGTKVYAQLHYMRGVARLRSGRDEEAIQAFEQALEARAGVQKLMNVAAYLATHGYHERALTYGKRAREKIISGELHGRELAKAPSLEEIERFITTVKQDMGGL